MKGFEPLEMLRVLHAHNVEFVVIGGFAAWMQGSPALTSDVDIIFSITDENVDRLTAALRELDAVYRDPMGRRIVPDAARFGSPHGGGHHLLTTAAGDLDVLQRSGDWDYDKLVQHCVALDIGDLRVRFATLEAVLDMKMQAGRPKDAAGIPFIEAAIEARDRDD